MGAVSIRLRSMHSLRNSRISNRYLLSTRRSDAEQTPWLRTLKLFQRTCLPMSNLELKRLKPKLDIVKKPENRVHRPYSRVSPAPRKSTNVGNHSHLTFVHASITVKIPGHGTGG